ncbi:decarboxylating 6-phosphogluconate dehydrogenase [Sporolactobacillus sp. THM7-4]|nr:decarboxylating 6-phosphogluconate dehydrogenase [Sporolactobacillus sp. THM7-4]
MEIGMIGLGKMGQSLALNSAEHGFHVKVFDISERAVHQLNGIQNIECFTDLNELVNHMAGPRVLWLMVPAGKPTLETVKQLLNILESGDIVIDGGNSKYTDSIRHYQSFKQIGVSFLDVGTSGGVNGARHGACLMVGGDKHAFDYAEPLFKAITVPDGYLYTGKPGSGHFLKMVHNGIEYGMMESIAEGFEVLEKSSFDYDNRAVAKVWNHGSVIRSWLVELLEDAFTKDNDLDQIIGVMDSSGEGKWTVETAIDLKASTPVLALSLIMRYRSLENDTFTGKVVAALRNEFGGHPIIKK